MSASWYKLKSGEWGVKIRHDGQAGETVEVTNKKGETKTVHLVNRDVTGHGEHCIGERSVQQGHSNRNAVEFPGELGIDERDRGCRAG